MEVLLKNQLSTHNSKTHEVSMETQTSNSKIKEIPGTANLTSVDDSASNN